MLSSETEEKRQSSRRRLGRLAMVKLGNVQRYCLVTDISEGGLRLHVNGFNVPDDFVLVFPEGGPAQSGNYKVAWRNGLDLGAKFISP